MIDRTHPPVVDDGWVDLRTVAGLLTAELIKLFWGDLATAANVSAIRDACDVVHKELATLAELDLMRTDEPGLPEFHASLDQVIEYATAILKGRASLDDANSNPGPHTGSQGKDTRALQGEHQ